MGKGSHSAPTVLVTGASGFVGGHLCRWLTGRGWRVRAAVRPGRGVDLVAAETVQIGALAGDTDWTVALAGVDAVVHLAARVHVMKESEADPLTAFRAANVFGLEQLARSAAARGVRRLVFISSIKVNGEVTAPLQAFSEKDMPVPQDPYGVSKWEAEQALARIATLTGLEAVILRPPLVYGPRVGANFLRLLRLARRGVPLPLASVRNRRSMVFVGNLCSAIQACLACQDAAGRTYLVSDGEDVSTADLIRRMAAMLGTNGRLWPLPVLFLRAMGAMAGWSAQVARLTESLVVDNSRLCQDLDWHPPFTLDQGLAETADWFLRTECQGEGK